MSDIQQCFSSWFLPGLLVPFHITFQFPAFTSTALHYFTLNYIFPFTSPQDSWAGLHSLAKSVLDNHVSLIKFASEENKKQDFKNSKCSISTFSMLNGWNLSFWNTIVSVNVLQVETFKNSKVNILLYIFLGKFYFRLTSNGFSFDFSLLVNKLKVIYLLRSAYNCPLHTHPTSTNLNLLFIYLHLQIPCLISYQACVKQLLLTCDSRICFTLPASFFLTHSFPLVSQHWPMLGFSLLFCVYLYLCCGEKYSGKSDAKLSSYSRNEKMQHLKYSSIYPQVIKPNATLIISHHLL